MSGIRQKIVAQFKRPSGPLGWLAGTIMAARPSNQQRNVWTVDLLKLVPNYKVLEVGCGPGVALTMCAAQLCDGHIMGIDHSALMTAQAHKRLSKELAAGKAQILNVALADLITAKETFDRIFSLNVIQFLPDIEQAFRQIHDLLKIGGMVATTYQPRSRNATRLEAQQMAQKIETTMAAVGFRDISRHELASLPVPAVCVTGFRACHEQSPSR